MCAETDQDRRHRQEVLRQTDLLEATRDDKKYTIIKMLLLVSRIPFQRMVTEQIGSKFPLSTINIFTLDVPVVINI